MVVESREESTVDKGSGSAPQAEEVGSAILPVDRSPKGECDPEEGREESQRGLSRPPIGGGAAGYGLFEKELRKEKAPEEEKVSEEQGRGWRKGRRGEGWSGRRIFGDTGLDSRALSAFRKGAFWKRRLLSHVYGLWKEFQPKKQILKTPHVHEKKILLELTCTKVGEASLDRSQLGKSHWDFHLCAFIGDACLCITRVREFIGDAGLCAISSNTRGNS